ncbi:DUF982 domain-containing protein [Mesorhizobium sp. AR10]|uniref:DUF982 domain-containing protein n=1 Tax=Mesorhizobium sp. AR10 TaxID=2865839 RepID=UPI00215FA2B1|nr:DUF982 domain-containing protein [Mesorhizobium sp. AR10]UVK38665.1 DUF982 domain-containing protein [Mesorhizobium sp. AR10]
MQANLFKEPVAVLVGLGYPARIETVTEALALLDDWPSQQRGSPYNLAVQACRECMQGRVDAETARSVFVGFAKRADILAPRLDVLPLRDGVSRGGIVS